MDRQNDKFKFGVSSYSERGNTELKDEDVQIVMAIKVEIVIIPPPYYEFMYLAEFGCCWHHTIVQLCITCANITACKRT